MDAWEQIGSKHVMAQGAVTGNATAVGIHDATANKACGSEHDAITITWASSSVCCRPLPMAITRQAPFHPVQLLHPLPDTTFAPPKYETLQVEQSVAAATASMLSLLSGLHSSCCCHCKHPAAAAAASVGEDASMLQAGLCCFTRCCPHPCVCLQGASLTASLWCPASWRRHRSPPQHSRCPQASTCRTSCQQQQQPCPCNKETTSEGEGVRHVNQTCSAFSLSFKAGWPGLVVPLPT
jgi:hypothetical protein